MASASLEITHSFAEHFDLTLSDVAGKSERLDSKGSAAEHFNIALQDEPDVSAKDLLAILGDRLRAEGLEVADLLRDLDDDASELDAVLAELGFLAAGDRVAISKAMRAHPQRTASGKASGIAQYEKKTSQQGGRGGAKLPAGAMSKVPSCGSSDSGDSVSTACPTPTGSSCRGRSCSLRAPRGSRRSSVSRVGGSVDCARASRGSSTRPAALKGGGAGRMPPKGCVDMAPTSSRTMHPAYACTQTLIYTPVQVRVLQVVQPPSARGSLTRVLYA